MKSIVANWTDHVRLTPFGKVMLANSMIFSRFRYGSYCMGMPEAYSQAIQSDAQALIWGRDVAFDAEEQGTEAQFRRFMKENAQWGDRKTQLGLGSTHTVCCCVQG